MRMLAEGKPLPARMRDHPLVGGYDGCRECHISPDRLLVYKIGQGLILYLTRTGTHSGLFWPAIKRLGTGLLAGWVAC